ncbi:MAG: glycosyltransferase [Flammeovirgaceae bacterium]
MTVDVSNSLPLVSILIAARNEEANIIACLTAITKLDYPSAKFEVWIGDDQSSDQTHQLVATFIQNKPNFHLKYINGNLGNAQGKANVLAHLAHEAQGELFCITDADVVVPPTWIQGLLESYQNQVGMITGVTSVSGQSLFAKCQSMDWLYALSLIKLASAVGKPVTAMGNNMLITREAYFSVGGYETIPFSVTEDFELFRQVKQQGWQTKQLYHRKVLAQTLPVTSWQALLQQRKRWMVGAMQVAWYIKSLLASQLVLYLVIALLLVSQPVLALSLWFLKAGLQAIWMTYHLWKLKQYSLLLYLPFYEPYFIVLSLSSLVYSFSSSSVTWKGRVYS